MKLIKPKQISGEIMNLIEEAESKVIIVCPYYKISKWYKLLNTLNDLKRRKVDVEFYVRENEYESIKEVERAGFSPFCIPDLHTKLYLNERYAIVSSMNLLLSSEINSLDIAMGTENNDEYEELYQYYTRYLRPTTKTSTVNNNVSIIKEPRKATWIERLRQCIKDIAFQEPYIKIIENKLVINGFNRYEAFIWNDGKISKLRISGVLSSREFKYAECNMFLFESSKMKIELQEGFNGHYDLIWGTLGDFISQSIIGVLQNEEQEIFEAIAKFIAGVEEFKKTVF